MEALNFFPVWIQPLNSWIYQYLGPGRGYEDDAMTYLLQKPKTIHEK